jgi:CRP/FNR family transcriptional regulator
MRREDYFSLTELQLPERIWEPLAQSGTPTVYQAGQLIYVQGSAAERFYYIVSGRVRSYISGEDGSEKLLTDYRSGSLFGEAAFFDQRPRVSTAVAVTGCKLVSIDRQQITHITAEEPEIAMALLKYLARTVRLLSDQLDDATFLQADQRLARLLVNAFWTEETITTSQEELATAIGVSRVTVSRILSDFARQGILKTGYRELTLVDGEKLRQIGFLKLS